MKKKIRLRSCLIMLMILSMLLGNLITSQAKDDTYSGGLSGLSDWFLEYVDEDNQDEKAAGGSTYAEDASEEAEDLEVLEEEEYTSKEEVAAYLNQFGHLPSNFITKSEAKKLGWVSSEGNLGQAAPGKSIGGDYFGNYEELLPVKEGREYHECDIDSTGGYRGAKRIIYSNDGLIYYTEDHYQSFELLYGEED